MEENPCWPVHQNQVFSMYYYVIIICLMPLDKTSLAPKVPQNESCLKKIGNTSQCEKKKTICPLEDKTPHTY